MVISAAAAVAKSQAETNQKRREAVVDSFGIKHGQEEKNYAQKMPSLYDYVKPPNDEEDKINALINNSVYPRR